MRPPRAKKGVWRDTSPTMTRNEQTPLDGCCQFSTLSKSVSWFLVIIGASCCLQNLPTFMFSSSSVFKFYSFFVNRYGHVPSNQKYLSASPLVASYHLKKPPTCMAATIVSRLFVFFLWSLSKRVSLVAVCA